MAWQLKARIGVQSVSPSIPSFKKNAKKYVTIFELKQHRLRSFTYCLIKMHLIRHLLGYLIRHFRNK